MSLRIVEKLEDMFQEHAFKLHKILVIKNNYVIPVFFIAISKDVQS